MLFDLSNFIIQIISLMTVMVMEVSGGFLQNLLPISGIFHNRPHLFTYTSILILYLPVFFIIRLLCIT